MSIDFSKLSYLVQNEHQNYVKYGNINSAIQWKRALDAFAMSLRQNLSSQGLEITSSTGIGRWAYFPWIRIAFPVASHSNDTGVFIDYLFGWEDGEVFLTLLQGVDGSSEYEIFKNKRLVQDNVKNEGFNKVPMSWNLNISGSGRKKDRVQSYADGMIFYKQYTNGKMPDSSQLESDLQDLIKIYRNANDVLIEKNMGA